MNLSKTELKMSVMQDLGKQFEERETGLSAEVHRLEGAHQSLKQAAEKLEGIKGFYQKEVDENRFEESNLAFVMKVVDRCRGVLMNLGDMAHTQRLMKLGELQESKRTLDLVEKIFNDEKAKVEAVLKVAVEDGKTVVEAAAEMRPPNDAAADLAARRAAAKAEREAKEAALPVAAPVETAPAAPQPPVTPLAEPEPAVTVDVAIVAPVASVATPSTPMILEPEPPMLMRAPELPTPKRQMISRRKKG